MKNRVKYLEVSSQVIADILKLASKNALPDDARIIRTHYNNLTDCFELIIHSKKFPIIPEGALIPRHGTPVISSGMIK